MAGGRGWSSTAFAGGPFYGHATTAPAPTRSPHKSVRNIVAAPPTSLPQPLQPPLHPAPLAHTALAAPRQVSQELVSAYLARRGLDYLVGFELSPLLWRKLGGARSAGGAWRAVWRPPFGQ